MNIKHLVKSDLKYVICPVDSPNFYIHRNNDGSFSFVDNIQIATKFASRSIALTYFYAFKSSNPSVGDLVIIPLEVNYSLIEVTDE